MNQDDFSEEQEPIEGYCVRCRESVDIENPIAVWTRKGMPATRGECSICGGTVFRMGKTDAHNPSDRPEAVEVDETASKRRKPQLQKDTIYVNFAPDALETAERLVTDLNNVGLAAWLHETESEEVAWASGVHPALQECARMVLVLSPQALQDDDVAQAWQFFRSQRKPVVIAQASNAYPPDELRRSPRYDFQSDYKRAFREMLQTLST